MITVEKIATAQKAQVETLFGLSSKTFESVEKLAALNLAVAKAAIGEAKEYTLATLSAKDAQEFLATQTALLQPTGEKVAAYGRQVYDIVAEAGAEFTKVFEAQAADAQAALIAAVDAATKNAPSGTETAVSLVKSTLAAANDAYESANKAAKHAVGVAEANIKALANTAAKATPVATTKAKRSA